MAGDARTRLYEHLAATGELPVDRTPSRLLGEAQAVADDLRDVEDPAVAAERAAVIVDLLAEIEGTGHPEADEHVARARDLAARLAGE